MLVAIVSVVLILPLNVIGDLEMENPDDLTTKIAPLDTLRAMVHNHVTADYMLEDFYLDKFLQKSNYVIENAVFQFREYVKWRGDEDIDSILTEDWTEMRAKFPFSLATKDKNSRPILYRVLGEWDMAEFLKDDHSSFDRLLRYVLMMHEESEALVRKLRWEGSNITMFVHLINGDGFTIAQNACSLCMQLVDKITKLCGKAPFDMGDMVIVNAPQSFKVLYSAVSGKHARVYGQNRNQWEPELLNFIAADQLPEGILRDVSVPDNNDGLVNMKDEL